jgi:hypothetical protein
MNVLADRHHAGLFHSLQLLGKRMGWTVYAPAGMGWWDEWYWSFGRSTYNDDRLAAQFLRQEPGVDGLGPLPDGEFPDWPIPTVTLEQARQMDWDFVIATVPDNERGFARFAQEMGAQYVVQVGNTGQYVDWSLAPLVLSSSEFDPGHNGIIYHQEMDPVAFVPPREVTAGSYLRFAASFVNCMPSMGACYDLLAQVPFPVDVYGIDGPQGIVKPYRELVRLMALYGWGWHDKAQGDGFGHVIHSWAAVGRPLVGHAAHYAGKMGSVFWTPATSIDLALGVEAAVETIRSISPSAHSAMCYAIREEFDRIDYDGEAEMIADFLGVRVAA